VNRSSLPRRRAHARRRNPDDSHGGSQCPRRFTTEAGSEDVPGLPARQHGAITLTNARAPRPLVVAAAPVQCRSRRLTSTFTRFVATRRCPRTTRPASARRSRRDGLPATSSAGEDGGAGAQPSPRGSGGQGSTRKRGVYKGQSALGRVGGQGLSIYRHAARDLIGCGNLGLLSAVEKFEWQRGYRSLPMPAARGTTWGTPLQACGASAPPVPRAPAPRPRG